MKLLLIFFVCFSVSSGQFRVDTVQWRPGGSPGTDGIRGNNEGELVGAIVENGNNTDPCGSGNAATEASVRLVVPANAEQLVLGLFIVGNGGTLTFKYNQNGSNFAVDDGFTWYTTALNFSNSPADALMSVPPTSRLSDWVLQIEINDGTNVYYQCVDLGNGPVPGGPYAWHVGGWSSCSAMCDAGQQSRDVTCRSEDGTLAPFIYACGGDKPAETQFCNTQVCEDYNWRAGAWGPCSESCGSGERTRTVECIDAVLDAPIGDALCADVSVPRPNGTEPCNTFPCVAQPPPPPAPADDVGSGTRPLSYAVVSVLLALFAL